MTHEQCAQIRNIMHSVFSQPVRDGEIEEAAREISNIFNQKQRRMNINVETK